MEKLRDKFDGSDLNVSDRAYCNNLYLLYVRHFSLLNKLYTGNTISWIDHTVKYPFDQDPFPEQTRGIKKYLADIEGIYKQANTAFIMAVERYFRDLYNLKIAHSYVKKHKNPDAFFTSYDPIIINIILQEDAEWLLGAASQ
jgi:hypothetical protein